MFKAIPAQCGRAQSSVIPEPAGVLWQFMNSLLPIMGIDISRIMKYNQHKERIYVYNVISYINATL